MAVCKILNFSLEPRVVPKNTLIANVESIGSIASCKPFVPSVNTACNEVIAENFRVGQSQEVLEKFMKDYNFTIGEKLNSKQRPQLLQLLYDYKDVFAKSMKEIKQYEKYELNFAIK